MIFPFQEYIFHLEPGRVDSGKGKCSYDPKLNSVSALISEYLLGSVTRTGGGWIEGLCLAQLKAPEWLSGMVRDPVVMSPVDQLQSLTF